MPKALCRNYGGNMKTVILCGGIGTRLREETEFKPKPMVNIGTRPILWHIMKNYCHYGFKEFVLCLGYKGEMIKEYFYNYEVFNSNFTIEYGNDKKIEIENNHAEKGWKVTLAYTGDKTLKGARLKKIAKYIDGDTFMVTYGDGVATSTFMPFSRFTTARQISDGYRSELYFAFRGIEYRRRDCTEIFGETGKERRVYQRRLFRLQSQNFRLLHL